MLAFILSCYEVWRQTRTHMHTHKMHWSVTSYNLISVCFNLSHYTTADKMEMSSCSWKFNWLWPKKKVLFMNSYFTSKWPDSRMGCECVLTKMLIFYGIIVCLIHRMLQGGKKIHEMEMIMGSICRVVSEANIKKDYQGLKSSKCTEAVY